MENKNIHLLDKFVSKEEIVQQNPQVLLIGQNLESEAVKVLKDIGLRQSIDKVEHIVHEKNSIAQLKALFNRNVYKGHMIKELCNQYDLKLIRVDNYEGEIPLEIGEAIIKFRDEHNYEHERSSGKTVIKSSIDLVTSKFFILVKDFENSNLESYTLFYRENEGRYDEAKEKDTFIEVHSGGKPFSKLREFRPLLYNDIFIFMLIVLIITNIITIFGVNTLAVIATSSVFLLFSMLWQYCDYLKCWNQKFKRSE
jgi:hypothetical protein